MLISSQRLLARIESMRWASLGVSLALSVGYIFLIVNSNNPTLSRIERISGRSYYQLCFWGCIFTFLGFGMQRLNFTNPHLEVCQRSRTALLHIAPNSAPVRRLFIVQWAIPDVLKWALIVMISFTVIMSIYEFLIRRFNLMRILFGMKTLPGQRVAQPKGGGRSEIKTNPLPGTGAETVKKLSLHLYLLNRGCTGYPG